MERRSSELVSVPEPKPAHTTYHCRLINSTSQFPKKWCIRCAIAVLYTRFIGELGVLFEGATAQFGSGPRIAGAST